MIDKVDVTIATKNNEYTIGRCIENIKKYIPYNRIIVVDDSEDNTPEIAEQLGAIVHRMTPPVLMGEKRYLQAELAETEWMIIIDSDVFVNEKWWGEVSKYMTEPDVGAINAWVEEDYEEILPQYEKIMPQYEAYTKSIASLQLDNSKSFPFSNLLIRRKFILDTKGILQKIHFGEDTAVATTVIEEGYKIVKIPKILGIHYHKDPIVYAKMAHRRWGESIVKAKGRLRGYRHLITPPILTTYYWLRFSIRSRRFNFKLYRFLISLYIEFEKGIISRFWTTLRQRSG